MPLPENNNLSLQVSRGRLCTALGVKLVSGIEIVTVARAAGYDCLFVDLEHSPFSMHAASQLCQAANLASVSPMIRVPHECGNGFVQRVLDGEAKGIIVPHIRGPDDARAAVRMIKYPPRGIRSINPSLIIGMGPEEAAKTLMQADAVSFVMIETPDALSNLNAIAAVPGLDVMLVGSMDITTELGILAQWSHPLYQDALRRVSQAAKMHNKLWGISGLFTRPDIWTDAVQNLGASFIVGSLDLGILNRGAKANVEALRAAELKQATSSTNGH